MIYRYHQTTPSYSIHLSCPAFRFWEKVIWYFSYVRRDMNCRSRKSFFYFYYVGWASVFALQWTLSRRFFILTVFYLEGPVGFLNGFTPSQRIILWCTDWIASLHGACCVRFNSRFRFGIRLLGVLLLSESIWVLNLSSSSSPGGFKEERFLLFFLCRTKTVCHIGCI